MAKFTLYKYIKLGSGEWQYKRAAFHSNGKIKPNVVLMLGVEERHAEGSYFVTFQIPSSTSFISGESYHGAVGELLAFRATFAGRK